MTTEIEHLKVEYSTLDLAYELLVLKIDDPEEVYADPNDEIRGHGGWLSHNQSLRIRKEVVRNAYNRLSVGELQYMSHKDLDCTRSKWCTDNEDESKLWDDDFFHKSYGEIAF